MKLNKDADDVANAQLAQFSHKFNQLCYRGYWRVTDILHQCIESGKKLTWLDPLFLSPFPSHLNTLISKSAGSDQKYSLTKQSAE